MEVAQNVSIYYVVGSRSPQAGSNNLERKSLTHHISETLDPTRPHWKNISRPKRIPRARKSTDPSSYCEWPPRITIELLPLKPPMNKEVPRSTSQHRTISHSKSCGQETAARVRIESISFLCAHIHGSIQRSPVDGDRARIIHTTFYLARTRKQPFKCNCGAQSMT